MCRRAATTRSSDKRFATAADHAAAASRHSRYGLYRKFHSRFHAEHAWGDVRLVWERFQLVPLSIGEVGIVGAAGFHPASLRDTFQTRSKQNRVRSEDGNDKCYLRAIACKGLRQPWQSWQRRNVESASYRFHEAR